MIVVLFHLGREHLGVEHISASLKDRGHRVFLAHDPDVFGTDDNVFHIPWLARRLAPNRRLLEYVRKLNPDLAAFSCYTSTFPWAAQMAADLRQFYAGPIVMGGIHITLAPDCLAANPQADFGLRGEGEHSLPMLADALAGRESLEHVPGLVWDGGRRQNPLAAPADLDSLPFADKTIFEHEVNYRDDYLIMASRGCVNNCTYCCERNLKQLYGPRHYRRRSPQNVMAELVAAKRRHRFREVMFYDAVFALDKAWLKEFLTDYERHIGVKYRCLGHVRFFDLEMAEMLRRTGCYNIEFGLQTVNEQVRAETLGRPDGNDRHQAAFAACDQAGLRYDICHMFGLPGESEADFRDAAAMYAGLRKLNRVKVFYLTYFPYLAINEIAQARGMIDESEMQDFLQGRRIGNYFHSSAAKRTSAQPMHRRYAALFKVIPLLPARWVRRLLGRPGGFAWLGRIPAPAVIVLQALAAIRGRDYRFLLMAKSSAARLARAVRIRAGGEINRAGG